MKGKCILQFYAVYPDYCLPIACFFSQQKKIREIVACLPDACFFPLKKQKQLKAIDGV